MMKTSEAFKLLVPLGQIFLLVYVLFLYKGEDMIEQSESNLSAPRVGEFQWYEHPGYNPDIDGKDVQYFRAVPIKSCWRDIWEKHWMIESDNPPGTGFKVALEVIPGGAEQGNYLVVYEHPDPEVEQKMFVLKASIVESGFYRIPATVEGLARVDKYFGGPGKRP